SNARTHRAYRSSRHMARAHPVPRVHARADLDIALGFGIPAARDGFGDQRRPALSGIGNGNRHGPGALFKAVEMLRETKRPTGVDPNELVDAVPELKASVFDRDTCLGERQKGVIDKSNIRHARVSGRHGVLTRHRDGVDPPVLRGELPAHPLLEHEPVDAGLQRAELEGPFARVDGLVAVTKAAFVLVVEQRQCFGIIRRNEDLAPGSVFPQPDGQGFADARLQDFLFLHAFSNPDRLHTVLSRVRALSYVSWQSESKLQDEPQVRSRSLAFPACDAGTGLNYAAARVCWTAVLWALLGEARVDDFRDQQHLFAL